MSHEENTALVRGFFTALDNQDFDVVGNLLASDYRLHFDGNPEMDRAAGIGFFGAFLAGIPDIRHQVQDQLSEGDRVATRIMVRGTHQNEMMGVPATGNEIAISAINIVRVVQARSPSIGSTPTRSACWFRWVWFRHPAGDSGRGAGSGRSPHPGNRDPKSG